MTDDFPNTFVPGQPARPWPRPNRPLPFAEYDNYQDIPPDGWELDDVEIVWWTLASRMSKKAFRKKLSKLVNEKHFQPHDCFWFTPVADIKGRGRYPRGIILVVKQLLSPYRAAFVHKESHALRIEQTTWHLLTKAVFEWCEEEWLPEHLLAAKLEMDLGL